jgi:hypothetical protein
MAQKRLVGFGRLREGWFVLDLTQGARDGRWAMGYPTDSGQKLFPF